MESDAKASDDTIVDQDQAIQVEVSQLVASIVTNVCDDDPKTTTTTTTSRMQEEDEETASSITNANNPQQQNETNKENATESGKHEVAPAEGVDEETTQDEALLLDDENDEADEDDETTDHENHDAVADVVAAIEEVVATAKATGTTSGTSSATPTKSQQPHQQQAKSASKSKKARVSVSPLKSSNIISQMGAAASPSSASAAAAAVAAVDKSAHAKRRKKDPCAPKAPLNGYLVYFNEERAEMRRKNPGISFGELTKVIAQKWKELPNDDKQRYIVEADADKERYTKEMADYKKSDAYKQYVKEAAHATQARHDEQQLQAAHTDACAQRQAQSAAAAAAAATADKTAATNGGGAGGAETPNMNWLQGETNVAGFDVPIFTEEFIEHSKAREHEMRQMRKELNELEQQNSVLHKHTENLRQSTLKLDRDIEHFTAVNSQLNKSLDIFRQTVLHCFNQLPLPNTQECPTPGNVDDYIARLLTIVSASNQADTDPNGVYDSNRAFTAHVKSIFGKINFGTLFDAV